jgi:integrase
VDTLPENQDDWIISNPRQPKEKQQVSITFGHGAKGREFYIDEFGDKMGPQGAIKMPLSLCESIHKYRNNERELALKHVTRGVRDLAKARQLRDQTVHLYLHPTTGKRYTGDQIYRMWRGVERPPHWSPHLGRHWWACQYLWQKMQEHSALIQQLQGVTSPGLDHPLLRALKDTVMQVIHFDIQPQLRHANSATTEIYLIWLFNQLRVPLNMTRLWNEDDGETEK